MTFYYPFMQDKDNTNSNSKVLSLPSALITLITSYTCNDVYKLPKLYMALLAHRPSGHFLPLRGFVIFHDM